MSLVSGFKDGFKEFGHRVNNLVVFVAMLFAYVFGIGIISVASKLLRKRFLDLGKEKKHSYWSENLIQKRPPEEYEKSY